MLTGTHHADRHTLCTQLTIHTLPERSTQLASPSPCWKAVYHLQTKHGAQKEQDEFWTAAEGYLATQEERGLCSGPPQSRLSSAECEQESPFEVSLDEFGL